MNKADLALSNCELRTLGVGKFLDSSTNLTPVQHAGPLHERHLHCSTQLLEMQRESCVAQSPPKCSSEGAKAITSCQLVSDLGMCNTIFHVQQ